MLIFAAYHRAQLAEVRITQEEFAADPLGAMERASNAPGFEEWAQRRLVSASALRAIFDDVRPNEDGKAFGIREHRIFARQLQVLG